MRIKESRKSVKFKDFVDFVKKEAKKVNDPTYGSTAIGVFQKINSQDKDQRRGSQRSKTTYVSCEVTKEQSSISCSYCNTNKHSLDQCFRMMALSRDKRIEYLKGKGHCFGCLKKGHLSNQCTRRSRCNKCDLQHPTLLHVDYKIAPTTGHEAPAANSTDSNNNNTKPAKDNNRSGEQIVCSQGQLTGVSDVSCAMAIIPVRVSLKNKAKTIETYVFFDPGNSVSFCTEKLMSQLCVNGKKQQITINTMGDSQPINTYGINGLQLSDLKMECTVELPKVYTKDEMPVSKSHIPTKHEIQKWAHLSHIQIDTIDSDIGIMIGNNVPDAYAPFEVATGPSGSPHATRTRLGWILWNVLRDKSSLEVNRVYLQNEVADDKQLNILMQSFNYDFPERLIEDKRNNSIEDNVFLQQVESSIHFEDEHYYVSLPFRDKDIKLPNNSQQRLQRLRSLRNKFMKDVNFKTLYCEFMNKIISKGYAERVPEDEIHRKDGTTWYLPHHRVFHPQKQKIRVVFDCSDKCGGISLNDQLLQGPNLANNLLGVLVRFREEHIAIVGDIESMFYQVKVPTSDRDCLRFYWWENGNFENNPLEFRMTVHLYGATSSPSCCNFALQYNANKHRHDFEVKVIETITRNMYVDDCLTSTDTEQKASLLIQDVRTLCQRGGFNLTKWTRNSRTVMESIPEEVRAKDINEWNLSADSLTESTLGVHWFILEDKLGFRMNIKNQPSTRRGILSVVSSVYDPIGLASPFVLSAKAILQGLCQTGMSWDEEVSAKDQIRWNNWLQQLKDLETVNIYRCYKPDSCEQIERTELHCFSDASEVGYGVVFYLRIIDKKGNIHCSFVLGKSRVAPLKRVTVPRMELTAATSAVRISQSITSEISLQIDDIYFWTDSMSVLRYISNTKTRFHTFVANRLAVIHDATEVTQWNYIGTKENPADLASRGATMDKFVRNTQWFNGPDFLWRDSETWSSLEENENLCISSNDPEVVMKSKTVCTTTETCEGMERLLSYFSSWTKMTKAATWIIHVKERLLNNCLKNRNIVVQHSNIPSVNTMRKAKSDIIAYVQRKHFRDEILALQSVKKGNRNIKASSKLINLKPFIDSDGILRVGGRLERSDVSYSAKYPIILPKKSVVSKLIIEDIHRSIGHLGKNSILAVLRQNYWILGANGIIKGIISKCVVCRKYQGSCEKQQMACLPKERLQADDPPFTRVGIDFFGSFEVKQGRSTVKRYGVIFTCLIIRAIHLELAFSMDTDSCINAIRRFIARRGKPQFIRTDNGTNFVSSNKELKDEIKRWNTEQIQDFMLQRQIQWEFNPPSASHFGGVWERLIRSVRKVLHSVMYEQNIRLSDEGLMTLFCEVEGILNNRPITESSEDVNDLEVLTPNHLLLQRQCESFPPGLFHKSDNYVRRRWRQIQYLADLFWTRWRKEYLPLLQCRQTWTKLNRNIKEGDIVLISDNSPRNSWSMGRVQEFIKDRDNLVRVAKVKTANSVLTRPITKLCLVVENDT